MDSIRGSLPPSFVSFRLENQIPENDAITSSAVASPPVSSDTTILESQTVVDQLNSPRSAKSEQDINSYADAKVESMQTDGLFSNVGLVSLAAET